MNSARTLYRAAGIALLCAALPAWSASPFAGKWRFNESRSKVTGIKDSIAAAGLNTYRFTYGNFSWNVKADGTDQITPFGNTIALEAMNASTWKLTSKINGKLISTDTWTLSPDGKAMTRISQGTHETGEPFSYTENMKRTAGSGGFEGTWEAVNFKGAPPEVDVEENGEDGLTVSIPAEGMKFSVKFDGKEYPVTGPRVPPNMSISAKMAGPRKINARMTVNGKPLDNETWEVSADGKTFTYTEKDAGVDKPMVSVYDRAT